jgi:hypothetical protein
MTVTFGRSMPSASASAPIDIGLRATRRTARARAKLTPVASATARRRWWSRTRSDISSQTSRAVALLSRSVGIGSAA